MPYHQPAILDYTLLFRSIGGEIDLLHFEFVYRAFLYTKKNYQTLQQILLVHLFRVPKVMCGNVLGEVP